jgi:hypothetical protein
MHLDCCLLVLFKQQVLGTEINLLVGWLRRCNYLHPLDIPMAINLVFIELIKLGVVFGGILLLWLNYEDDQLNEESGGSSRENSDI